MYTYIYIWIHLYICLFGFLLVLALHVFIWFGIHIYIHTYVYIYIYMYTHIHTYIYIYRYASTYAYVLECWNLVYNFDPKWLTLLAECQLFMSNFLELRVIRDPTQPRPIGCLRQRQPQKALLFWNNYQIAFVKQAETSNQAPKLEAEPQVLNPNPNATIP